MVRWYIDKYSGNNDFGLWKSKMQVILIQDKCINSLKSEALIPAGLTQVQKTEMLDKARSVIIFCLGDKFLREVAREKNAVAMWGKLESLYLTKSLAHILYLKQQFYSF